MKSDNIFLNTDLSDHIQIYITPFQIFTCIVNLTRALISVGA